MKAEEEALALKVAADDAAELKRKVVYLVFVLHNAAVTISSDCSKQFAVDCCIPY
jgi:hypothetical protein